MKIHGKEKENHYYVGGLMNCYTEYMSNIGPICKVRQEKRARE